MTLAAAAERDTSPVVTYHRQPGAGGPWLTSRMLHHVAQRSRGPSRWVAVADVVAVTGLTAERTESVVDFLSEAVTAFRAATQERDRVTLDWTATDRLLEELVALLNKHPD